tara:strand:+ start:187 stop:453 length:267 start_codon:yes stop_codon:yes gene_type:complete
MRLPKALIECPLDFGGGEGDAVAFLEGIIAADRLAVDADEVVGCEAVFEALIDELGDGGLGFDGDVIGETAAVVIDIENLQNGLLVWK